MHSRLAMMLVPLVILHPVTARGQDAPHVATVAPSSFATVAVHVSAWRVQDSWDSDVYMGPARIAITYGQPHARGRTVVGGLIPIDSVWRLGANLATTLDTDVDIAIGSLPVPRGHYTLYVLNQARGWSLIVSRAAGQVGAYDYDMRQDVGRVPLAQRNLSEPEEALSIYLVSERARSSSADTEMRGVMRIKWGSVELQTPWRVTEGTAPRKK